MALITLYNSQYPNGKVFDTTKVDINELQRHKTCPWYDNPAKFGYNAWNKRDKEGIVAEIKSRCEAGSIANMESTKPADVVQAELEEARERGDALAAEVERLRQMLSVEQEDKITDEKEKDTQSDANKITYSNETRESIVVPENVPSSTEQPVI